MTTRKDRRVTIVVHTDGDLASRQYRVPVWAFEAGKWGALVVGLLVVLFFAFAGPIGRAAARVPGLERQVARLEEENSRVQQLAAALNRAEANYQELRTMLGVRAPREKGSAPTEDLVRAVAVRARPPSAPLRYEPGPAEPTHWPLDLAGFVTRGQVRPGDPAESHPGIDIAVPAGTAVRAAGAVWSKRPAPTRPTDCSCSCGTRAGMKPCMGTPRASWCAKATRCRRGR